MKPTTDSSRVGRPIATSTAHPEEVLNESGLTGGVGGKPGPMMVQGSTARRQPRPTGSQAEALARRQPRPTVWCQLVLAAMLVGSGLQAGEPGILDASAQAWRAEHRLIDLHQHVDSTEAHLQRCIRIMDAVGVGTVVNLSGGTVTHQEGENSEFQRNKELADRLFPGRFTLYFNLDYASWDAPDFADRAVRQVEEAYRLGAAGLKEFKRLGLYLRNRAGQLIKVDDPKLDAVWKRCGELGMPVSIHVADPQAFWRPYDPTNERWEELKDHPAWWFGDPAKYPPFQELLDALDRVIGRHPRTQFVCVHFANNAEDLDWVDAALDRRPNMFADLAARIPELGRHDPAKVRALFVKHQDRILFGTDFQVYDRLILGSSGNEPPPTDAQAIEFYAKEWRWLETKDRGFAHMTPIQGNWTIDAIGLPPEVLRKVYFDNARRLLVRSLPPPTLRAARISRDFQVNGKLTESEWGKAGVGWVDVTLQEAAARPALATKVRALWSDQYLYLAFEAPYRELTVFRPVSKQERLGLWDEDVVEVFVGSDPWRPTRYAEFEVAPTGETLDVMVDLPDKDFAWSGRFEAAVKVDRRRKVWTTELRIHFDALGGHPRPAGERWRLNLYRNSVADDVFLAWSPTATPSAHTPERFGWIEFVE